MNANRPHPDAPAGGELKVRAVAAIEARNAWLEQHSGDAVDAMQAALTAAGLPALVAQLEAVNNAYNAMVPTLRDERDELAKDRDGWKELAEVNAKIVDDVRAALGIAGAPGHVVELAGIDHEDAVRYRELLAMHEGEFPQFGIKLASVESERDALVARVDAVADCVRDFNFTPDKYPDLCSKYGCEGGQLYQAIRRKLSKLVADDGAPA